MKIFFSFFIIFIVAYNTRPMWENYAEPYVNLAFMDSIDQAAQTVRESFAVREAADKVQSFINSDAVPVDQAESPSLSVPDNQLFSVYNVQIGDVKADVEAVLGNPQRISRNEYGSNWYAYHENYQNFLMISYDNSDRVNALYTNQNLISSQSGAGLNASREQIHAALGEPLDRLRKGLTYYLLNETAQQEYYKVDNHYIIVFYDLHENSTVTAIKIIEENLEAEKSGMYGNASSSLRDGFEYQLFDLTNADRVKHGLSVLSWNEQARATARAHSADMAEKNYFSHDNLEGQSPFDRMEQDGIPFTAAGENLAYGQFSSIFAHEGLMNSAGHRKNILSDDFRYLSVGVAFNEDNQPYFTETFFNN